MTTGTGEQADAAERERVRVAGLMNAERVRIGQVMPGIRKMAAINTAARHRSAARGCVPHPDHLLARPAEDLAPTTPRDVSDADFAAWCHAISVMHAREPLTRRDVVVFEPGEEPCRVHVASYTAQIRSNNAHCTERQIGMTHVPDGHVIVVALGDHLVQVLTAPVKAAG